MSSDPPTPFDRVYHVLQLFRLPENPSQAQLNGLWPWDLAALRDNLQLEHDAELARVHPRPLEPQYAALLRRLFQWYSMYGT
ncbi:uncharacterized protein AKAW2_20451S [Aspergillus luchuensis]|uniref:Uncharacterized protein n=1 Tax=Aspergillus kawachii TaxID=1069201 RepID=A0A7R8A729_ASPKA|nr:uncharacterized protein AKAW2_20451S [Aspergillus luchuensis]BCR95511.1 hypothetical protein AKAW2_20451S [Aspergillus luchuensis]BCS08051.1 hypothetical protein ALUC_20421S [Aspergillus luchuensis]GAA88761.1 hypothetical protein AKAW_06875 [Aspergillus luchuensis IFO 4308]